MMDIHNKPYSERLQYLKRIPESKHIKRAETRIVDNEDDLRKAIEYFSGRDGSEGCYIKHLPFIYELDGKTLENVKFKRVAGMDVEVVKVHKVEGANAWNYLTAIRDGDKLVPSGKTFNTSIPASVGNILKINFVNINEYHDPDTGRVWFGMWSPRVVMKRDKKEPDTVATAKKLVKSTKSESSEKKWPSRYKGIIGDQLYEPWLKAPDENKRWRGMMQIDTRKKAAGLDFRYQTDDDNLFTWSVFLPKGLKKEPASAEEAKSMITSEILPVVEETMADPMKKFVSKPESRIEGKRDVFEQGLLGGGPGEIQPRYMWTFESFDVEFGAIKPEYIELFAHGDIVDGKVVIRKIKNRKEWKKTPKGFMTWMMFQTKDPTPYTISRRAVKKKYTPEYGRSALPRKIRSQIPEEFHYWKIKDEKDRMKMRDELVEAIKKKEVNINVKEISGDAAMGGEFKYQKQTWKGPVVVREGPSRTEYHLLLKSGKTIKDLISDSKPPTAGVMKRGSKTRWKAEGDIEPKTKLNPTKNTPSKIELIDSGKFRYINSDRTMIKFEGKELKGVYTMREDKDSGLTNLKKTKESA